MSSPRSLGRLPTSTRRAFLSRTSLGAIALFGGLRYEASAVLVRGRLLSPEDRTRILAEVEVAAAEQADPTAIVPGLATPSP